MNIYKKSYITFRQKQHRLDMHHCLMNSFFLYWNQERRFLMNKKYLLQIIIIASLAFGVFTLFVLLFLAKHQILFMTENNISDDLFRYFLDFIIYGLLLDPLGWALLSFLVVQFHKKNHNITQTIIYAVIRKEKTKDLLFYWSIDFICLFLSFNVFNNSIITVSSEFFVLILTPILSFYSLFLYLVKKTGLYSQ